MKLSRDTQYGLGLVVLLTFGGLGFIKAAEYRPAQGPLLDAKLTVIPLTNSYADAVSPNGKIVGGHVKDSYPFIWTQETGVQKVDNFPPCDRVDVSCVLDNGTIFGYYYEPNQSPEVYHSFVWSPSGGLRELTDQINSETVVFHPSASTPDGHLLVGSATIGNQKPQSAIMVDQQEVRFLKMPVSSPYNSMAMAISADGKVIVGTAWVNYEHYSLRWVNEEPTPLKVNGKNKDMGVQFLSLTEDGKQVLMGEWNDLSLWKEGRLISVYSPKPQKPTLSSDQPNAYGTPNWVIPTANFLMNGQISRDGSCVLSNAPDPNKPSSYAEPRLWTERNGLRSIAQMLRDAHLGFDGGYKLCNVTAMSRDGRVLVGYAQKGDQFKAFVLNVK